jgi:hypothetical protein
MNALNETQDSCRTLNMAQKGHSTIQNDPNVLNFLDTFKFMTHNAVVKPNGFVFSIKSNRFAFCSVQAELSSTALLLQAVEITLKPVAIVNTFNGPKKFEIIGIAQGGNMLKNSQDEPKMAVLMYSGMAVNTSDNKSSSMTR